MRKAVITAAMIGLMTLPVVSHAQQQEEKGKNDRTLLQIEQEERARRAKDVDKDYQQAIKRSHPLSTPSAPDPWQNVRPASTPSKDKKTN
jgi:hypothetical protein